MILSVFLEEPKQIKTYFVLSYKQVQHVNTMNTFKLMCLLCYIPIIWISCAPTLREQLENQQMPEQKSILTAPTSLQMPLQETSVIDDIVQVVLPVHDIADAPTEQEIADETIRIRQYLERFQEFQGFPHSLFNL